MDVVLLGRSELLYNSAIYLLERGHAIKVIITAKAAPEYKITEVDFEKLAKQCGAEFLYAPKIGNDVIDRLRNINGKSDIGLCVNYPTIINSEVLSLFYYGILNAHGGDLPRYRGNACQAWAILNGEKRIGLCIHKVIGGELDSGDIVAREYYPLDINSRIGEVWDWMNQRVPHMFAASIEKLQSDPAYVLERQSRDKGMALRCYPRRPEDGRIDWNKTNMDILRLINASSEPYSGAYCMLEGEKVIIWRARLVEDDEKYLGVPGHVCSINNDGTVDVICGRGKLQILDIERRGARVKPVETLRSIRTRLN